MDKSVKKIKGLLNLRNKKTEKAIELRYDKRDLQDSVQNIKEEVTHMERRLRKESYEEAEPIFLADSCQVDSDSFDYAPNRAVALSRRLPQISCIEYDG